jgi:hypothetical protein
MEKIHWALSRNRYGMTGIEQQRVGTLATPPFAI